MSNFWQTLFTICFQQTQEMLLSNPQIYFLSSAPLSIDWSPASSFCGPFLPNWFPTRPDWLPVEAASWAADCAIIFCRTSRIFSCRQLFVGKTSTYLDWNAAVACAVNKPIRHEHWCTRYSLEKLSQHYLNA